VAACDARLRADGPNAAAAPPRRHLATRALRQLTDPLVALLLAAAVVTTVLRDYPDTAVIVLVVLVNTAIGVVQEVRADRAIGRATGTVVRTGAACALGRITALVASTRPAATPLQRRLAGLGRMLGFAAVVLSGLSRTRSSTSSPGCKPGATWWR
jgi:magnesium-transporting ATPase (P-type)